MAMALLGIPVGAVRAQTATDPAGAFAIGWEHTGPDGTRYARIEGQPEAPASAYRFARYFPSGYQVRYRCLDDVAGLVAAGSLRLEADSGSRGRIYAPGDALSWPAGQSVHLVVLEPSVLIISGMGPFRCGPWHRLP